MSCSKNFVENEQNNNIKDITFLTKSDNFLKNFIEIKVGKLEPSISYTDAICAGATYDGYTAFLNQIKVINASLNGENLDYWRGAIKSSQEQTKSQGSSMLPYDKYNALEQDKFLEYFVCDRGDSLFLNIDKERALLMGATAEGCNVVLEGVGEVNTFIKNGTYSFEEVKECFDKKREDLNLRAIDNQQRPAAILRLGDIVETPPSYYGGIYLERDLTRATHTFYGSRVVTAHIGANTFSAIVYLKENSIGRSVTHIGFSSSHDFSGGLTYPEGTYYSFSLSKSSSQYDATANFIEVR